MFIHIRASLCFFFNKKQMTEYFILKPKNLDLKQRVDKYNPDFDFNLDLAYYFISGIIDKTQYSFNEKNQKTVWNDCEQNFDVKKHFIRRNSKINQKYNSDYKKYIQFLMEDYPNDGRILWGCPYSVGKSFGYQLSPYYFNCELEIYKITDKNLLRRIAKKQKPAQIDNAVRKKYNFLINYFDKNRLKIIEPENAMNDLFTQFKETKNLKKYLSNSNELINMMNNKFPLYHKKQTDGRIHTAITNFPKKIRKYLRYDNEILGEVDLSSSIPFIIYYILDSVINNRIQQLSGQINNKYLLDYMLTNKSVTLDIKEVERFGQLIMDNQLYDTLKDDFLNIHLFDTSLKPDEYLLVNFQKLFDRPFDGCINDDLKMFAKKRILSMLFAKPNHFLNEQAIFQKYFPTIHLYLKQYKKSRCKELIGKGQHKKLSYLGFQIESDFMLNHIARDFNNQYKRKKIILSLHDCCITQKKDVPLLEDFMRNKFMELIGYSPNLKVEYWEETEIDLFEIDVRNSA
jgi:hypothetical protein